MKTFLLWALVGGWCAANVEVRAYRVSRDTLESLAIHAERNGELKDPFVGGDEFEVPPDRSWPVVKETGFASRFLKEDGGLLDASKTVEEILNRPMGGKVVYDSSGEQLVMKAESEVHEKLGEMLLTEIATGVRSTVSVYELGQGEENSALWISEDFPEGGRLLGSLTVVGVYGVTSSVKSSDGKMELEMECQRDSDFDLFENRFTLTSRLEEARFKVMTSLFVPPGIHWVHEMGTTEEGKRIALVIRQDDMTNFGVPLNQCFLKEEEGPFLDQERLASLRERSNPPPRKFDLSRPYQVFRVPTVIPGALPDESSLKTHPAINGGKTKLKDLRELLEENGVTFREGDFALLELLPPTPQSRLYARLSKENLLKLDEIVRKSQAKFEVDPKVRPLRR